MRITSVCLPVSLAFCLNAALAAPTSAPAPITFTPPTSGYEDLSAHSDKAGDYRVYDQFVSGSEQVGKNPVYWVKVTRQAKAGDPKSEYPAEYLLFEIDCASQTYVIKAQYELGPDGADLGPTPHVSRHPVRKKLPSTENRVYVGGASELPELWAAALLQPACFPGD